MENKTEERRLAAIMFTDMVGYSALTQRDEALALELLEEHRQVLRGLFVRFHGGEIETMGDGFLVEFGSALEAVRCAMEIQGAMARRNATVPERRQIQLRIGIHLGDVVHRDGQVLGDGVNIAARLEPLAKAGGVCISSAIFEQVQNKIAATFASLGPVRLKNLARPVEVYEIQPASAAAFGEQTEESTRPGVTSVAVQESIAVLPFVNLSDDRENEFLSDGMTEDVITALSQVKSLRVPARTSSFAFKGKNEDIRKIGQILNVRHVLEGSVRKAGNRLRLTAQLISVADGYHLWSERFDRDMVDVFAIQDEMTRAIVEALRLELIRSPGTSLVKVPTSSTAAYQLYLRGREAFYERGIGLQKAFHYFKLALLQDPNYALAHAGLADTHFLLSFYGFVAPAQAIPEALATAERAVQLAPDSGEARVSLATIKGWCGWQFEEGVALYTESLQLNPRYPQGRAWYGSFLSALGRHEEALEQHRLALELDPLSPYLNTIHGWGLIHAGRSEQAFAPLQRGLELAPDYPLARRLLGQALVCTGRVREGIDQLARAAEAVQRAPWVLSALGHALAKGGQVEQARAILEELSHPGRGAPLNARSLAVVYAGLGESDAALSWLERALADRDVQLPWLNVDPVFTELRREARFQALVRQVGLAPS